MELSSHLHTYDCGYHCRWHFPYPVGDFGLAGNSNPPLVSAAARGTHPNFSAKVSTVTSAEGNSTPAKFVPPPIGTVRSASPWMLSTLVAAPIGGSHLFESFHVEPANVTTPANVSGASHANLFAMNPPVAMPMR